uniref:Uncharacterized protein n=1 Tax=Arundo donax TaxID=35708 RepID=A0A0A9CNW4_ARUDO
MSFKWNSVINLCQSRVHLSVEYILVVVLCSLVDDGSSMSRYYNLLCRTAEKENMYL